MSLAQFVIIKCLFATLGAALLKCIWYNVLMWPPTNKLRDSLATNGYPDYWASLRDVQQMVVALNESTQHDLLYVHVTFAVAYVALHVMPSADQFYMNLIAGAIYGKWFGLIWCTLLSVAGSAVSLCLNQVIFGEQNDQNGDDEGLGSDQTNGTVTCDRFRQSLPQPPGQSHQYEPKELRQSTEIELSTKLRRKHRDDQPDDFLPDVSVGRINHKGALLVGLTLVRVYPFLPTWLLNDILSVLVELPLGTFVLSATIGSIPYCMYGLSMGQMLMTLDNVHPDWLYSLTYSTVWSLLIGITAGVFVKAYSK